MKKALKRVACGLLGGMLAFQIAGCSNAETKDPSTDASANSQPSVSGG